MTNTPLEDEIKPCPFCLNQCETKSVGNTDRFRSVLCPNCCAAGPICEGDGEAIQAWNTRPLINGGKQ